MSISIGKVASQVFLSDQMCPVALILQILKAGNVSYRLYPLLLHSESCIRWWHTQTRMKTRELTLRDKQAIWMLKEKKKLIRAIAKTKCMEKYRVWKPPVTPATNNNLIAWEKNSSWWQTNHKSCENVWKKKPTTSRKLGDALTNYCPQETLTQNHRCTARCKPDQHQK